MEDHCGDCEQSLDMEVKMWCETCQEVLCSGCGREHKEDGHDVELL